MNVEYLDDVIVRFSHHSTAIEGNSICLKDVSAIILNESIPKTVLHKRDFYEVDNHAFAMQFILDQLLNEIPLDKQSIMNINKLLLERLIHGAGQFKQHANSIKGASFLTATPEQTPALFSQWFDNMMYRLERADTDKNKIHIILSSHIDFERIHPFEDGNGRTGRLIMFYLMMQERMTPFVITKEDKEQYISCLKLQDVAGFYELVVPYIEQEKEILLHLSCDL